MTDKNKFLPAGTELIEANGTRYKIRRVIARGGSAVVYEAEQEGSFRVFVLKECYPNSTEFSFTRREGLVCPTDSTNLEAKNYLRLIKRNIERENKIGQLIANRTGRTVASWGKLNVKEIILNSQSFDAADSLFIVMERINDDEKLRGIFLGELLDECAKEPNSDAPLRNGGCPSPYIATSILEQLLKSLRDIHAAGYIHGDINDSNFFLMGHNFKGSDIGVGQLLDFGNAQEILEDGKTAPIKDVFSTPGYYSPEIFFREEKPLRLTPATDIYSVGCLMIYLFYGMSYKDAHREGIAASGRIPSVSISEAIRHGYRHDAAALFKKIFYKALQFKPEDRYQNGGEMLADIIKLKRKTAPPKFILAQNLSRSPYFVDGSRNKELKELQRDMLKGKHPLFIFGIGGIGKTELANEFAREQIKNGTPAYLVTFKGSMRETVLSMKFSGYESAAQGTEEDYQRRLDMLKEDYRGCLLIVDNFDDDEKNISTLQCDPAYNDVVNGSGMKILFTTRSRPDEITKELSPLSEEDAMKLFKSISPVAKDDEPIVRELIRETDCHPMTIELLAKTREDSWQVVSYKELLLRLRHRNIDDKNLPAVSVKKNLTEREAKIYGHLKALFDLYKLGEAYRQAICHVTLLPIDGFDAVTFVLNEDADKRIQLKNLESHSWIRRRKEENLLYIHPLIRSVFKNEIKPADEDCADFLKRIWNVVDNQYPPDLELFGQSAELFERATNTLQDARGDFAFYAGFCFLAVGKYSSALFYEDKAVKLRKVALADNPRELARTYNDAGVAALSSENFGVYADGGLASDTGLSALGGENFSKAMAYMGNSLKILESLPEIEDKQNLANVCASMAIAYTNREDFDVALYLAERAVKIFEEYPPENLWEKAHAHQSLSSVLLCKKRYSEALEQKKIDFEIKEKLIPTDHPELAKAYRELAECYSLVEDVEHAELYAKKALCMFEKTLPKTHPEILATYKIISEMYRNTDREEDFKFYSSKATEIFVKVQNSVWTNKLEYARRMIEVAEEPIDESILNKNPTVAKDLMAMKTRDLILQNRNAAEACRQLKDYDSAEKFISVAINKLSQSTMPIEESLTLFTASQIYFDQEKFSEALPLALAAVTKLLQGLPNNFDKLSEQFIHLGNVYSKLNDHESALKNFKRAVEVQEQNPNPENSVLELARRSAGEELMHLKRFDEAVKIFENLLAKQRTFLYETQPRIEAIKKLLEQAREQKL